MFLRLSYSARRICIGGRGRKSIYQIYLKSFLDTTGKGTGDLRGVTSKLSALRNSSDVLISGEYAELYPDNEELYIFTRTLGGKKFIIAANFTTHDVRLPAKLFDGARKILGNYSDEKNYLRATEAAIYQLGMRN